MFDDLEDRLDDSGKRAEDYFSYLDETDAGEDGVDAEEPEYIDYDAEEDGER